MITDLNSAICEGVTTFQRDFMGCIVPWEVTGTEDEFMATRTTASLGVFLNGFPGFEVSGPDAVKFLNSVCVNRDFSKMKDGSSRHAIICNEKGQIMGSGLLVKKANGSFCSYDLDIALKYYIEKSGMDVKGSYNMDEYFFQIDGPKSLEIMEEATQTDLHDLKFGQNKTVSICGTEMAIYRLGMSGALAYEVHGAAENGDVAFRRIREVLFKYGGKLQGTRNYAIVNHTPGGYPNQNLHFLFAFRNADKELAECSGPDPMYRISGSASDNAENFFVTPYDLGWGGIVNFEHGDFIGREALLEISKAPKRTTVTLEWNADDVADVFASQFRGEQVEPYDRIDHTTILDASEQVKVRGDYVMVGDKKIGVATGKTYSYYERKMISLACIDMEYVVEGMEVEVLWGTPGNPQKLIRAKVARYPYYNGEFRNETFDVEKIPHPNFE